MIKSDQQEVDRMGKKIDRLGPLQKKGRYDGRKKVGRMVDFLLVEMIKVTPKSRRASMQRDCKKKHKNVLLCQTVK